VTQLPERPSWSRTARAAAGVLLLLALAGCAADTGGRGSADAATAPGDRRTASGAPDFALDAERLPDGTVAPPAIDPRRIYELPALIDIAQRTNPRTQAAWYRAREAAAAVGVVEATYLPQLSANVAAGYLRTSTYEPALPRLRIPAGQLVAEGATVRPNIAFEWLLFDFGRRDAAREIAVQGDIGANIAFQGVHQQLIHEVTTNFFEYNAARADTRIARERVEDAETLSEIAEARLAEGLGTRVDVAQTRQIAAKATFELTLARNRERDSKARLIRSLGLPADTRIAVADIAGRRLPAAVPQDVDQLIETALARRPDIQAALARLRASEAGTLLAEAEFRPRVLAVGGAGRSYGEVRLDDSRIPGNGETFSGSRPDAELGVLLSIPLADGGLRAERERQARAREAAAERDLQSLRNTAATEIVEAYDLLRTSLAAYAAAGPLVSAAEETWEGVLGFYENGLASLAEVSVARTALNDAQMVRSDAFSNAFVAATTLAFATGTLTSRDDVP